MTTEQPGPVSSAFEPDGRMVALEALIETRRYRAAIRSTGKYRQIAGSIATIGLVEPPVVRPAPGDAGQYFLLDGHLRVLALKAAGVTEVLCLIATDDESFTYNKRVSRLTAAQEHRMIARALDRGVSEQALAEALGFNPKRVQMRTRLTKGIAEEVAEKLGDLECPFAVYEVMRRMTADRQREAVELMVAHGNGSLAFAQALYAASRPEDLAPVRGRRGASPETVARLESELESLQFQLRSLEDHYGLDALHFTLARGYLKRLLENDRVVAWIDANRPEYLQEFRHIVSLDTPMFAPCVTAPS
jgi:ParB-like chromosome segregation protein Spo0J